MDSLLDRLEELRLAGERALPEDIRDLVVSYAARHDAELADRVQRIDPNDLNGGHDAVFEAQGRVMLELAELRRVPNWQDLDLTLPPGDHEAAQPGRPRSPPSPNAAPQPGRPPPAAG